MTKVEGYVRLVVRTHLRRLELIADVTEGSNACTSCGGEAAPSELRLHSDAVPHLRRMARWTRVIRLRRAFETGASVEAICYNCEGKRFAAAKRSTN